MLGIPNRFVFFKSIEYFRNLKRKFLHAIYANNIGTYYVICIHKKIVHMRVGGLYNIGTFFIFILMGTNCF